ncbi:spore germination protein [Bacillus sp. FJAT-49736]|uniref:spore germination protein n=1 Tax=Bacillus sp. FJAT-49736 TaxID=2833582 RepID=UPI001BC98CCF|nr:spore germination protein [Bacillus sp. FJAT-49736]MBS4175142.1 spore germination protein [Bacillus sp. FJAT-49736]
MTKSTFEYLKLQLNGSADAKIQPLKKSNEQIYLIYMKSLCDGDKIQQLLVKPFFEMHATEEYSYYLQSLADFKEFKDNDGALQDIFHGAVAVFLPEQVIILDLKLQTNKEVLDASVETTIHGPQKALSENLEVNLNLIRQRYHSSTLITEFMGEIGYKSKVQLALLYDESLIKKEVLDEIRKKIKELDKAVIQTAGQLLRNFTKRKTLFPTYLITERPDRIAYNLALGKFVIVLQGTPFVLIGPAVFYDFLSSMEDLYMPFWIAKFLVMIRYIGLFISTLLPAVYVGVTSYNPELFRIQLALTIAGSRATVPFPSYLEVLFMLLMMELLVEASIRLPKAIGPTATTVGGLILGTAATEAGLVSSIMIIIVSAVAISNFVIPINEMGFAMRNVKYVLLFLASISGLIGVVVGLIGLVFFLVNINSLGEPYLKLFYSEQTRKRQV